MAPIVDGDPERLKAPVKGVCFVAPELDRIGGYELATLALARGLRERGVFVSVITTSTDLNKTTGEADFVRIEVRGRHQLLRTFPKLLAALARERSKYSIIHCPTFSHLSGLAVLAGRILRRPTLLRVATETDVREFAEAQNWKHRLFFQLLLGAAGVIAPSTAIRQEILRSGFSKDRLILLPNGVDVDQFRPATPAEKVEAKSAIGLHEDTLVIGTVTRLVDRKGIDVLLRAFGKVRHSHKIHLIVVGDGPLAEDLRTLAHVLRIEGSVSWLGFQVGAVNRCLHAMDVFAFPSRLEGVPNAVLEAMGAGLPIVATTIGGVLDLIEEGKSGVLVPPGDPEALAAALDRLIRNAPLRADFGYDARSRAVELFSLSSNISRLMDFYLAVQNA